ncbi:MAG: hypothetical protein RL095_2413 [Verrucomicrobiota bacterium]
MKKELLIINLTWFLGSLTMNADPSNPDFSPLRVEPPGEHVSLQSDLSLLRLSDPRGRAIFDGAQSGRRYLETLSLQIPYNIEFLDHYFLGEEAENNKFINYNIKNDEESNLIKKNIIKSWFSLATTHNINPYADEADWRDMDIGYYTGRFEEDGSWLIKGISLQLPMAKFNGEEDTAGQAGEWQLSIVDRKRARWDKFYLEGEFKHTHSESYNTVIYVQGSAGYVIGPVDIGVLVLGERHFSNDAFPLFQRLFKDCDGYRHAVGPRLIIDTGNLDFVLSHEWNFWRDSDDPEAIPNSRTSLSLIWRF